MGRSSAAAPSVARARFDMHAIYRQIFKLWRKRRFDLFIARIGPQPHETVLDLGGSPLTWVGRYDLVRHVDCLNVHEVRFPDDPRLRRFVSTMIGDGCALQFEDGVYDIVFCNSVIEHVGDWEKQCAFAAEIRRVGKRVWVQTPAFECPLEPHFMASFIHWLPIPLRKLSARWLTPWG